MGVRQDKKGAGEVIHVPVPIPGLRTDVPAMQPGVGGTPGRVEMGMSATD